MGLFEQAVKLLMGKEESAPSQRPGRNEPCWCGSGQKYKKCHLPEDEKKAAKAGCVSCGPS